MAANPNGIHNVRGPRLADMDPAYQAQYMESLKSQFDKIQAEGGDEALIMMIRAMFVAGWIVDDEPQAPAGPEVAPAPQVPNDPPRVMLHQYQRHDAGVVEDVELVIVQAVVAVPPAANANPGNDAAAVAPAPQPAPPANNEENKGEDVDAADPANDDQPNNDGAGNNRRRLG